MRTEREIREEIGVLEEALSSAVDLGSASALTARICALEWVLFEPSLRNLSFDELLKGEHGYQSRHYGAESGGEKRSIRAPFHGCCISSPHAGPCSGSSVGVLSEPPYK